MANNERPNLKQIRIKKSVCARLDERKSNDDSYTDVIQALLDENDRLRESNVELKQDKQDLTTLAKALTVNKFTQEGENDVKGLQEAFKNIEQVSFK